MSIDWHNLDLYWWLLLFKSRWGKSIKSNESELIYVDIIHLFDLIFISSTKSSFYLALSIGHSNQIWYWLLSKIYLSFKSFIFFLFLCPYSFYSHAHLFKSTFLIFGARAFVTMAKHCGYFWSKKSSILNLLVSIQMKVYIIHINYRTVDYVILSMVMGQLSVWKSLKPAI